MLSSVITPVNLDGLRALASSSPPGDFAEVGVYRGGSAEVLYNICVTQGRTLHLFDTFCGIPHKGELDDHEIGDFGDGVDLAAMRAAMPHAKFYVGTFPETMPSDLPPLAFVHEDSDQYASTKSVIERLYPLLVSGGAMYFDDYRTFDCQGSRRAIDRSGLPLRHHFTGKVYTVKP